MIFNRFFVSPHRSSNPETRLAAVAKLSKQKPAEKSLLHELAFNDEDTRVTLAALHKLNDFALWQKVAQTTGNATLKRAAVREVEQAVLGQSDLPLSESERKAYLRESASADLIVKVLMEDERVLEDSPLVHKLLAKVGRAAFSQQFFLKRAPESVQLDMLKEISDTDLLQKLQRKVTGESLKATIQQRLDSLIAQQQRPLELERQVTLVLSKLQALLEKSDYVQVSENAEKLNQDYADLATQFACLNSDSKHALEQKFVRIVAQVERHMARIKVSWSEQQQRQQARQALDALRTALELLQQQVNVHSNKLGQLSEQELTALAQESARVEVQLKALLETHSSADPTMQKLLRLYESLATTVAGLPAQQELGLQGQALLTQMESLQTDKPEDAEQWQTISRQWRELMAKLSPMPDAWSARWRQSESRWQALRRAEKAQNDEGIRHCRKHLNTITGLIDAGRYRVAMNRFSKLQRIFEALPESAKVVLNRRFEQTKAQIERLEGWQTYLAKPRKPALLEQAQALCEQTPEDIHQRMDTIRTLRQQWNSLGSIGDEQDQTLNSIFDACLEDAFQPCRQFFAEQEALRQQALTQRQSLLEQLLGLPADLAAPQLVEQVEALKSQWRQAGQVDKKEYQSLKEAWEQALEPIAQTLSDWYQANKSAKQTLIEQAQGLLELDDMGAACAGAQQLQEQWKSVGSAGRRNDSKLWQGFRRANDAVFAKAKQVRADSHQQHQASAEALARQLTELDEQLTEQQVDLVQKGLDNIARSISELPVKYASKLNGQARELRHKLTLLAEARQTRELRCEHEALLAALAQWQDADNAAQEQITAADWDGLGRRWQTCLLNPQSARYSRVWLTLMLEVTLGLASPESDHSERQSVQLAMMTAKLEEGTYIPVEELLEQWVSHGPLTSSEAQLLSRFDACLQAYRQQVVWE